MIIEEQQNDLYRNIMVSKYSQKKAKIFLLFTLVAVALLVGGACEKKGGTTELKGEEVVAGGPKAAEQVEDDPKAVNFALVSPNHPVTVGESNKITLEIQPRNGLKINHDFPWKVKFLSKNNLTVDEQELTADQIEMSDQAVKITIDVTPTDEGTHDLEGVGTFSVCSLKLCDIRRNEKLRFTLVAEPSA